MLMALDSIKKIPLDLSEEISFPKAKNEIISSNVFDVGKGETCRLDVLENEDILVDPSLWCSEEVVVKFMKIIVKKTRKVVRTVWLFNDKYIVVLWVGEEE